MRGIWIKGRQLVVSPAYGSGGDGAMSQPADIEACTPDGIYSRGEQRMAYFRLKLPAAQALVFLPPLLDNAFQDALRFLTLGEKVPRLPSPTAL